jgi:hypothetical protein
MGKLLRDCKKSGMPGVRARSRVKVTVMAMCLLGFIAVMLLGTGTVFGIAGGSALLAAPVLAFTLPEGLDLTESEKNGWLAIGNQFTGVLKEFEKGKISKEDALSEMDKKLKEWAEKSGYDADRIEKMSRSLKEQGEALQELKEKSSHAAGVGGLKNAFEKEWDSLQKALKDKNVGYRIKAINEHNPALIETTANIISTTTGANLFESVVNDPDLHLKRRDRQYIRDIANVSHVDEVPEVYTFWEEGDETGAIGIVAENAVKPQVKLELVKNQVEAKKAAGYIVVTEEVIKWRSRAWAAVQRLFRDKVYRDYENILTTQMTASASSYVSTPLDGTIAAPTDFDAIIATILQGEMLNYEFETLVLNPADKWRLAMTTTANGMFVLPYIQQGGRFALLGLRVITTNKIPAGEFLIGESGSWYIEEEAPQLRTGLVNDDFIHNRMTIIGEVFFLSYVPSNNAGSWIYGNFDDIKSALEA